MNSFAILVILAGIHADGHTGSYDESFSVPNTTGITIDDYNRFD